MKKFVSIVLCVMCVALASIGLVGCGEKEDKDALLDLADCEIGYELPVYPDFEFDYVTEDGHNVHLNPIIAMLIEKNDIQPDKAVSKPFYKYTLEIKVSGYTDPQLSGKRIGIHFNEAISTIITCSCDITEDGTFSITEKRLLNRLWDTITFYRITIRS